MFSSTLSIVVLALALAISMVLCVLCVSVVYVALAIPVHSVSPMLFAVCAGALAPVFFFMVGSAVALASAVIA